MKLIVNLDKLRRYIWVGGRTPTDEEERILRVLELVFLTIPWSSKWAIWQEN